MDLIVDKILTLIKYGRSLNPKKFTPVRLEIQHVYRTEYMKDIVAEIAKDDVGFIKSIHLILEDVRLKDIVHGLKFTINAGIENNLSFIAINDLLQKTEGFQIKEDEFQIALSNPKEIVKQKVDYKSDNEINVLIESRIGVYNYSESDNEIFKSHPRSFVLALIMINYHLGRFSNPIDDLANDYSLLKKFYESKDIDLMADTQFSKYNLLSIGNVFSIKPDFPPRIYDKNIDATIFLNGIEDYTFKYLIELHNMYNFNLALKPSSIFFLNEIYNLVKIEEHLEVGKYFDVENFDNSCITKLYDNNYDVLWINVDKFNITFEEIAQDFDTYNDSIITQVVHCEYQETNEDFFITHLDHEYIFYSIEEFDERQSNIYQKGGNRTRIKTFKIDNAHIPIKGDDNCLFTILNYKFKNKELLKEYFNKIN